MSFYDQLIQATAPERQQLMGAPVIADCLQGQVTLESYLAFLEQAFHHVRHTTPLLMLLGGRLPERLAWLRRAVAEYIEEEIGHEEWILSDIDAAGGNAEAVRNSRPELPAELMVAYAYDVLNRGNPAGFFGMVFVLEGTSVALALTAADRIQQALGLPDRAFSYLRSHGTLDQVQRCRAALGCGPASQEGGRSAVDLAAGRHGHTLQQAQNFVITFLHPIAWAGGAVIPEGRGINRVDCQLFG